MVINIKTKPNVVMDEAGAHDQAAAAIETTVTKTTTKAGEADPIGEIVEHQSEPVQISATLIERIDVGMAFKMPVASYTMLEFSIKRSVPFDPEVITADEVFTQSKEWVEGKLNELIGEQQVDEETAG